MLDVSLYVYVIYVCVCVYIYIYIYIHISGVNKKSNHQFHIQIIAIGNTDPVKNTEDTLKFFPGKSASQVVYICRSCDDFVHCLRTDGSSE